MTTKKISYDERLLKYQALDEHEKTILNILSFFIAPLSRTNIANTIKNIGYQVEATRKLHSFSLSLRNY